MPIFPPEQPRTETSSQTIAGSNTTEALSIFRVTGAVQITKLYGIVTTVLGSDHDGAYFRLNDQTAQVSLTESGTGADFAGLVAGSIIAKNDLVGVAARSADSAAGAILEEGAAGQQMFQPFIMVKKPAANTDIEYVYTTTETPTSGAIKFFCEWLPLSDDGNVEGQ